MAPTASWSASYGASTLCTSYTATCFTQPYYDMQRQYQEALYQQQQLYQQQLMNQQQNMLRYRQDHDVPMYIKEPQKVFKLSDLSDYRKKRLMMHIKTVVKEYYQERRRKLMSKGFAYFLGFIGFAIFLNFDKILKIVETIVACKK